MTRVADLLRQKRQAQIAEMEGRSSSDEDAEADRDLRALDTELDGLKRRRPVWTPKRAPVLRGHLRFTKHANRRMAQRGMSAKIVYAIWRVGTPVPQPDGSEVFVVTRAALAEATRGDAGRLERWRGAAIIVQPAVTDRASVLITVLADGEDTTFIGCGTMGK